jgi:hypothetical protein
MDSMEHIISSTGIRLRSRVKLKPLSKSWREGGSSLSEERFIIVDGKVLEEGGARERQLLVMELRSSKEDGLLKLDIESTL